MSRDYLRTKYLIIGAGLTGLSTAFHLNDDYILIETSGSPGGTASTLHFKGFKLDNAVHIFYFKDPTILNWIIDTLNVELLETIRKSSVWINNAYVKYPVQYHLAELHWPQRINSMRSILNSSSNKKGINSSDNFETYSLSAFGNQLTDIFVRPYNEKLFGVPMALLNTDWLGDYIPNYSRMKMLLSVLGIKNNNYGRNSKFYYPLEGGVSTVAQKLSSQLKTSPLYNCILEKVFYDKKYALLSDGTEVKYEYLINTIPLDSFLNNFDSLPSDILASLKLLKRNSTTLLHILGKGKIKKEEHWIYIPDPTIPFYRITIPGNINPANCPADRFALTLEFGGNIYENQSVLDKSIAILKSMGILNENNSDIEFCWKLINCSYVIYDENRKIALKKIFPFLQRNQIWSIGRYGSWEYSNMEDAILYGRKVAEQIIKQN
ncbi:MAG: FAD-dependent oxidoreductase [Ignavibacteriaceae bacterium]|nr:FAD-dependent oxidoreductase [Ignavibacteriaceae bacterium]